MNLTYELPINDVERDLLNDLDALSTDDDGKEIFVGLTREESLFYITHGKARVKGAAGTPEDNAEYERLGTLHVQTRNEELEDLDGNELAPESVPEDNGRKVFLNGVSGEVAPMRELLWELCAALPPGSQQNMNDEQRTILAAGFRLSRHLFADAAAIFEKMAPTASNAKWASDVAARIRTLQLQLEMTADETAWIH